MKYTNCIYKRILLYIKGMKASDKVYICIYKDYVRKYF